MMCMQYLRNLTLPQKALGLIIAVFGCIFYITVIGNHYYFRTNAFDYAVYNFALWDYSHFHMNTIPSIQVFGDLKIKLIQGHFTLALMYLVPAYWLLNWLTGSYTLLVLLVTCILWSGWAIYRLIQLKTNDDWLAVISVLYYFLLQGRYASFSADFHEVTIACCFVPIFLVYFELRKYWTAITIFILLLFSREDFALWFVFIFIVLIIWHWKEKKIIRLCLAGILASVIYFILLFKVFIPMCETPNVHYTLFQYSSLGGTPWEAVVHILKHPIDAFKLLYKNAAPDHYTDDVKKEFYRVYIISGGFLMLLRPQYIIWFIPIIAQKMFNDDYVRWSIMGYYGDQVVAIFPISIFLAVSAFRSKGVRYFLAVAACILAFSETRYKMNINNRDLVWGNTIKENVFDPNFFHPGYDVAKIHADLKLIPPDAKVCASESILPHVSQRPYAYEFPDVEDAGYIAVFTFKNFYATDDVTYRKALDQYLLNPSWKVIAYNPPFLLMKKIQDE